MSAEGGLGETRAVELETQFGAPLSAVWSALTDPKQLSNWFSREVIGSAGEGAYLTFSWDEDSAFTGVVSVWEPERHLRWTEHAQVGSEGSGALTTDFYLEKKGAETRLRLICRGFPQSSEGQEYLEAIESGWRYFLYNLEFYLVEYPQLDRIMVWGRRPYTEHEPELWDRIFGRWCLGLREAPETLAIGDAFTAALPDRTRVDCTLRYCAYPRHFAATIESMPGTLLFIELEGGSTVSHCGIWLSTYGLPLDQVHYLQGQVDALADRLFGAETRRYSRRQ